jgi:hypothetical protein
MEFLKIVVFSTFAAIAYGILHDQVTAHLCVEYFSVAHPDIFHTKSAFLLALGWGVVATRGAGWLLGPLQQLQLAPARHHALSLPICDPSSYGCWSAWLCARQSRASMARMAPRTVGFGHQTNGTS